MVANKYGWSHVTRDDGKTFTNSDREYRTGQENKENGRHLYN